MKKTITLCLIFASIFVQAQDNQIKLNLFSLFVGNFSLQFEHKISDHSSLCFGASYLPSRNLPSVITKQDSTGNLDGLSFSGFSFTPEYRYYFSGKAPKGFYLAPYIRYSKYSIEKVGIDYTNTSTNQTQTVYLAGDMKTTVVGLMLGSQWTLGEHFTLDWWMIGAGVGSNKSTFTGYGNFSPSDIADIKSSLQDTKGNIPGTLSYEVNSTSASISYSLPVAFRGAGLCLGYRF